MKVEREFIYTETFRKCWKAMGLGDDEQHKLENILLENPRKGAVIEGLAGIRKLRIKELQIKEARIKKLS